MRGRLSATVRALTLEIYKLIYQQIHCCPSRMVKTPVVIMLEDNEKIEFRDSQISPTNTMTIQEAKKVTLYQCAQQHLKYEIFWMNVPC